MEITPGTNMKTLRLPISMTKSLVWTVRPPLRCVASPTQRNAFRLLSKTISAAVISVSPQTIVALKILNPCPESCLTFPLIKMPSEFDAAANVTVANQSQKPARNHVFDFMVSSTVVSAPLRFHT